jgi:hypothetical protein
MLQIDSALGHHIARVAVAELVCCIPTDAENDDYLPYSCRSIYSGSLQNRQNKNFRLSAKTF